MVEKSDTSKEVSGGTKGTLFVTGGSYGIGAEIIKRIGKRYQKVVNYDIKESPRLDVRNPHALRQTMVEHISTGRTQHDLVVSAGVFIPKDFSEQSQEEIDFVLGVNLKGTLYTIQEFLNRHKYLPDAKRPNIVIISSISAFHHGGRNNVVYDATKAALSYIVKDLANFDCTVNAVEPGTVRGTKIGGLTPDLGFDENARKIIEAGQARDVDALEREVTAEDIAKVVEMLLFNNQQGAINGTTITVDAGLTSLRKRF